MKGREQLPKPYFPIAKLAMKIVEYLALFVVEHNVQRAPLHLSHAVFKSMVDLDQLVIVIMAVANHQGLGTPSLQILKSNPELTQSALWEVNLLSFFYSITSSFFEKLASSFSTPITLLQLSL